MKKTTLLMLFFGIFLSISAQTKITFEDQTLNGAAIVYNGSVSVVANPVTTGINKSAYCLDVVNNDYAPVKFTNFNIPAGAKATYPYVTLKFKIAYKAYNGGSDLDYPNVDVYSSATSPALDATEKLGAIGNGWGTHTSDSLVWRVASFTMASSTLNDIPNGILVIKVAKPKCEYLIDDVELVPSPIYNPDIETLFTFEANAINDTYTAANVYGGTIASTAVVVANPASSTEKSLQISQTDYNQAVSLSVTLPSGYQLKNYDRLYFDRYATSTQYAQAYIKAGSDMIYQDASGYPSQGAASTWITKDYEISSTATAGNAFTLLIGYTSMNSGSYFIDNVKLHRASSSSAAVDNQQINPLTVTCNGNFIRLNMIVDRLELVDLNGRLISRQNNANEINIANLSSGVYVVKSILAGKNYIAKVIK